MNHTIYTSKEAPAPIGPYNQAVMTGNLLFVSGQICIDPANGELKNGSFTEETHQVMKNLVAILKEAGMTTGQIVKTTIFLTDMKKFAEVNEVYGSYFTGNFPARETVQVAALPKFVNVEISVVAAR